MELTLASRAAYMLFGLLLVAPAWGETDEPSLELLEFLAEWQGEDGEWLDPIEFADYEEKRKESESYEESRND